MADINRYETINDLVISVMRSLGLTPPISVIGSSDKTATQLVALSKDVGQSLLTEHDWQIMGGDFQITTNGGTTYALPTDFDKFIPDAAWNYTTDNPALGSLSEFEWQPIKARNLGGTTFAMLFRVSGDEVEFHEATTGQQIILPYQTRGWVRAANGTRRDAPQQNDDVVLYDPALFRAALRLAWLEAKEFNTTRAERTYRTALGAAKAKDSPGRTMRLIPSAQYPFLGVLNIPDTGYGSA
jgi:hypothetical protein